MDFSLIALTVKAAMKNMSGPTCIPLLSAKEITLSQQEGAFNQVYVLWVTFKGKQYYAGSGRGLPS